MEIVPWIPSMECLPQFLLLVSLSVGSAGLTFDVPLHAKRCFRELFPAGKAAVLEYECGKPEILVEARQSL